MLGGDPRVLEDLLHAVFLDITVAAEYRHIFAERGAFAQSCIDHVWGGIGVAGQTAIVSGKIRHFNEPETGITQGRFINRYWQLWVNGSEWLATRRFIRSLSAVRLGETVSRLLADW
jgi:hypothetical protein